MSKIRLLLVTTDNREHRGRYEVPEPMLSSPIAALVHGFRQFPDEIEVHIASCVKKRMKGEGQAGDNIHFHQLVVPKAGWGRSLFLGCAFAVRRLAARLDVDLVHGQGTERDSAMAAVCSGKPSLVTIHGHMGRIAELVGAKFGSYYWMISRLERWIVAHADGVVCLNSYTQGRVQAAAKRTWVIPNAAEICYFTEAPAPAPGARGICVANIAPWKNQCGLIDACRNLFESGGLEIAFAGSVPQGNPYSAQFSARIESIPGIRHLGFLTPEQIRSEASARSFLVLPSIEENCPMAVIEAMASGIPVAASRVGGVPDLIEDGITGLLFDPADPAAIRRQIGRIGGDAALRATLAAKAHQAARLRFHPEVVARGHINAYRELLSRPS